MSARMLRDWTQSDKVNSLSSNSEVFFARLIMKADDFGCFYADERLLKANLFPLKLDKIREADLTRWMAECQKAGLIVIYESDSKRYLQIINYGQRKRQMFPKFPLPPDCGQLSADRGQLTDNGRPEVEEEEEVEGEVNTTTTPKKKKDAADAAPSFKKMTEKEFYDSLTVYLGKYSKELLRSFFNYWSEKNDKGKMRFQLQKTWEVKKRLVTWDSKNKNFNNGNSKISTGIGTSAARVEAASNF